MVDLRTKVVELPPMFTINITITVTMCIPQVATSVQGVRTLQILIPVAVSPTLAPDLSTRTSLIDTHPIAINVIGALAATEVITNGLITTTGPG
jgi:hypothetical protein